MKFYKYFFLLLFVGCQTTPKSEKKSADIEVFLNNEFTISLNSNPSTGYSWQWINNATTEVGKVVGEEFVASNNSNLVGSAGVQKFKFKALKRGRQIFIFHYIRPWEKGAQPAEKSAFEVEVK
jgi:inhibitor of cysteine peptidase